MEFGIEKVCHAENEKEVKRNNGMNWTIKSGKHQNTWRKELQKLENISSGKHETEMKEKIRNDFLRRTRKSLEAKHFCRRLINEINIGTFLGRYSWPVISTGGLWNKRASVNHPSK